MPPIGSSQSAPTQRRIRPARLATALRDRDDSIRSIALMMCVGAAEAHSAEQDAQQRDRGDGREDPSCACPPATGRNACRDGRSRRDDLRLTVKWSVPDTGCPSSESTDHRIAHSPDTFSREIDSEIRAPRVTGGPLEMSFPDCANTCTFVNPAAGGSSNVSRIFVGRAVITAPIPRSRARQVIVCRGSGRALRSRAAKPTTSPVATTAQLRKSGRTVFPFPSRDDDWPRASRRSLNAYFGAFIARGTSA
jgi:hypothetical protein